ncbi:MAG: GNAT family N-acetyltransferase [Gammaproteobacteria bacterium]
MLIRPATLDDAFRLIILLEQLGYKMTLEDMEKRIKIFHEKNNYIFVAEENEKILGVIAFGYYEKFIISASCCHIEALVVDENYRNQNVGKKLMQFAEEHAIQAGAKILELITSNRRRDKGAHRFYESLGYKDHIAIDHTYFEKRM